MTPKDWERNFNLRLDFAICSGSQVARDRLLLEYLEHYLILDSEYQDPKDHTKILQEAHGL